MKVLLTHAYFVHEDPKEQKIMRPYPPLGLLYIAAYLEMYQIDNQVFDTTFSSKKEFNHFLLEKKEPFGIIALYTNLMTKVNVIESIKFIKSQAKYKNTKIVLGGPDLRYNKANYLNAGADILVIGEGEVTMLELVKTIQNIDKPNLNHIKGIAFKDENGTVIQTAEREKIRDIDTLPFPNRKAIDLQKYFDVWKKRHGQSAASVSTQRGCPYTCRWCSTAVYGQSYRRRSPQKVAEELLYLKKNYQPDTVWFVDDVFTVSHKWLESFKNEVIKHDAIIPFECITRADRLKAEVLDMLKAAGAFRIWIGAESGSQRIIDAMDRRVEVGKVRDMIRLAREKGMEAGTFIMLGYPTETEEDIEETIHHLKVSNPDHFTITIAYPIKGTGLFQEIEAVQTNKIDWEEQSDRARDFERTYPRPYYDFAVRRVVNEVNYHKKTLENKQWTRQGLGLKVRSLAAKAGMWYWRQRASWRTSKKGLKKAALWTWLGF